MRDKLGRFVKGYRSNPKYEFKKGQTKGSKNVNWKNGRYKISYGYIVVLKSNHPFCDYAGYVYEHRLVVEKQISRYLLPTEHCHHLNKIKDDNRPENLMAFISNSAHGRFHQNPENVKPEEIVFDGRKLHRPTP